MHNCNNYNCLNTFNSIMLVYRLTLYTYIYNCNNNNYNIINTCNSNIALYIIYFYLLDDSDVIVSI